MIRGKQSKEAVVSDGLVAGGAVRVSRGGADLVAHVNAPADGSHLGTRGLLAGDYVAADESGNSHAFTVEREGDLAVIPVQGGGSQVTVVGLGGDVVDRIGESRVESPKPASTPRASKPAAKEKT